MILRKLRVRMLIKLVGFSDIEDNLGSLVFIAGEMSQSITISPNMIAI